MIPGLAIGALGPKDYIIAGLGALCFLLLIGNIAQSVNTYANIHVPIPLLPDIRIEGWKPWGLRMQAERDAANGKLETSNASIDRLTATIEELNAEANARAEAFENSQQEARREAEALERAAERSGAQIASLRALAARGGTCAVPADLSDALEGL